MCNCINERIDRMKEAGNKLEGCKSLTNIEVDFKHYNDELIGLAIPVVVSGLNSKDKKVKKTLYYSVQYCPFCGEKLGNEIK